MYSGNYFDLNTGNPTGQGAGLLGKKLTTTAGVPYAVGNTSSFNNCTFINFMCSADTYPILTDVYDYYLYGSLISDRPFSFRPNNLLVTYFDGSTKLYDYDDFTVSSFSIDDVDGFQFYCKLDMSSQNGINAIILNDSDSGVVGTNLSVWYYLIPIVKDSSAEQVQSIITAINNQTGSLQGSIGQAADDVQQSIEDQYHIEDEEDFGFSDIQHQYEEKMGVLTFGTETTIQMLELFSPSNAGEAYIRVPGWSMDVQGETYQIWDEYVFYFDSIEENFPFLVTTMRTFTVAMFYVAIVGYITKVYERNFLAK